MGDKDIPSFGFHEFKLVRLVALRIEVQIERPVITFRVIVEGLDNP